MTNENKRIQQYIDEHRLGVLTEAFVDLNNASVEKIGRIIHRLKGTLGTFQFQELASKLQDIYESIAESPTNRDLEDARKRTMEVLEAQIQDEGNMK